MLTKIVVDGDNSFYVPILGVTPKDSLLVRTVTGLNPPDLDLFIGEYARDGGEYQGRRVGKRNIVITMGLNPNPGLGETPSGLRELLYKAFLDPRVDADHVKLEFHSDTGRVIYAVGYVEKFEGDLFSDDTMAQISLLCPDPYLRDTFETDLTNAGGWLSVPFTYAGTASTGFETEIYLSSTTPTLILDNNSGAPTNASATDPRYYRGRMVMNGTFLNGDVVYVNTIRGSRQLLKAPASAITSAMQAMSTVDRWAALKAAGSTTSIINALTATSAWLELHSQANTLKVYGATQASLPAAMRRLKFRNAYWGI